MSRLALIGTFALTGCAGSEPTQDAVGGEAADRSPSARAPEDAEAGALVGHKVSVLRKLDFKIYGRATLGFLTLDFRSENDRLIRMECDAVALGAPSGATRWVDPGEYVVAGVEGINGREGVNVLLYEKDGTTPSDWSITCYTQLRKPLAREVMGAVQTWIAIDPT